MPAMPAETKQSTQSSKCQEYKEQRDQAAQEAKTRVPKEMHRVWHPVIWIRCSRRFTRGGLYIRDQAMRNPSIVGKYAQADQRSNQYQRSYDSKKNISVHLFSPFLNLISCEILSTV
jgi:hypothetical protein